MNLNKLFAEELRQESATTRKMLERVPPEKFNPFGKVKIQDFSFNSCSYI